MHLSGVHGHLVLLLLSDGALWVLNLAAKWVLRTEKGCFVGIVDIAFAIFHNRRLVSSHIIVNIFLHLITGEHVIWL